MDNKKIPTSLGAIIILIIAITVGWFVWKCEDGQRIEDVQVQNVGRKHQLFEDGNEQFQNRQIKQTEENQDIQENSKEEVSFCGKTYGLSREALGDNVNVIKRIAEILKSKKYEKVCRNYEINTKKEDFLEIQPELNQDGSVYFDIFVYKYKIDSSGKIYILSGFDGTPEFIGELK